MTDPASVIKLRVDDLIQRQIIALKSSQLTSSELTHFHARSAQLNTLFGELDRAKPLPPYPVHKSKHRSASIALTP
jgi:hypothetical protein